MIKKERIFYGALDQQFGDLRLPDEQETASFPVVIVIHGGFWKKEVGLTFMDPFVEKLTEEGFATWNIEYHRVGHEHGGWPGTFSDVSKAAAHLSILAETYPLDMNRVVVIGHSAGGHLGLWLAGRHCLQDTGQFGTVTLPRFNGVVSLAGVNDLQTMYEVHHYREKVMKIEGNPVAAFIGGKPERLTARYQATSPMEMLPLGVPQAIIHGAMDINVPVGISRKYAHAAKEEGDDIQLEEIPEAEHFMLIDPDSETWPILLKHVKGFLTD